LRKKKAWQASEEYRSDSFGDHGSINYKLFAHVKDRGISIEICDGETEESYSETGFLVVVREIKQFSHCFSLICDVMARPDQYTKKEYNLMLQKYIRNKSFVKINRTVCEKEEDLYGFIIGMSQKFLFLQLDNEFMLDGYALIRLDDFDSIRHSSYERARRKIFAAEGFLTNGYGFDKDLPLTSWTDILKTLKKYDIHVVIKNVRDGALDFWIGPITRVSDKSVSIHNYDPGGKLDDKPTIINLDTISVINFRDRYSTIFRKYLKS
jgi:hypothetical protein